MRDRQVYFPKLRWYDLYSGKVYDKGNHTLTNISLTAKVPLFLAEGKAIFLQNTANVTKTNQLTNVFELVAGLHLESNGSTTISTGNGSMISIQNYNDEPKLTSCLSQGCQYAFKLNFTQTQTSS
jgi:alpha-glucosidase (family GH31 glycosyl hydrolase)